MHRTPLAGAVLLTTGFLLASLPTSSPATASEDHPREVPVYSVVQEGMTPGAAKALAARARIGLALRPDGAFSYVDNARYLAVPKKAVPKRQRVGRDEERQLTVAQAVNLKALYRTKVISPAVALRRAKALLPAVDGLRAIPTVDYTRVDISNRAGRLVSRTKIDTTVTYSFRLGGLPVVGAGAKQRISFDGAGRVIQLSRAVRSIKQDGTVPIISSGEALEQCQRLYGARVKQGEPTLVYYAPPLGAVRGSGRGAVQQLLPQYSCQPQQRADQVRLTGKLIPAAPQLTPKVYLNATRKGDLVHASMDVAGGTGPLTIQWSSSTTALKGDASGVEYRRTSRGRLPGETLSVTVTDVNGQTSTATVNLNADGEASASGIGGAGGALAEVGIEQTVDEWQCAQDSANGFRSVMQSKGQTVNFDWRGASAFEKDFKDKAFGGWDSLVPPKLYVDQVDAQWYTGHGWPGGVTFKSSVGDTSIVPGDARWGNGDLEWMQLESCQVLRDTNGRADYFARWDEVFAGLHLLNGFDTNAYCISGGTGARFAGYLFPQKFLWWTLRPAYTVAQAWATMANDLEPAGVRWRSISPMKGSISNLGDHFWGQGSVGPDITPAQRTGFIAISGVS
jgi:Family of unknown function (DUF6345)